MSANRPRERSHVVKVGGYDKIEVSSTGSFPASNPPGWIEAKAALRGWAGGGVRYRYQSRPAAVQARSELILFPANVRAAAGRGTRPAAQLLKTKSLVRTE